MTSADYEVKISGRRHDQKICHINLLKKWYPTQSEAAIACLALKQSTVEESVEEDAPVAELHG